MKKISLLAAFGLLVLGACVKDPLPVEQTEAVIGRPTFTATTESPATKTTLTGNDTEGYSMVWQSGDRILIADNAGHAGEYTTESTTEKGDFAFVSGAGTEAVTAPYRAWYPAILYNDGTPALPLVQHYTTNNIAESPMYASGSSASLEFKNLCGIIRLNISTTNSNVKVKSVKLSADQGMSGTFTISNDAAVISSGTAGVTLDCGTSGVAIGGTTVPFYIAVPAGTYTNLAITVTTTTGARQTRTLKSDKSVVVGRSSITNITLPFNSLDSVAKDLSAKATANTYIVSSAGTYRFNATIKGNGGLDPLTGTTATTFNPASIAGVKVLWELYSEGRAIKYDGGDYDIGYADGYVYFNTPDTFVPGDACVAIYDSSDNILWSWVIWATPYPDTMTHNGVTFMDRNLGAIDVGNCMRGFLYEWGRKDAYSAANGGYDVYPYVPVASSVFTHSEGASTMAYTVAHPTDWIRGGSSTTWMTGAECAAKPWRANEKTIYDPCPAGWRIPTKENISGISGLPDTGLGGGYDPTETYMGFGNPGPGYYWTASTDGGADERGYAFCNDGRNIQHWGQDQGYAIRPVEDLDSRNLADYTDLSANGTANSYVIHEPGQYRFKATVKGNGTNQYIGISPNTNASTISNVTLLWASYGNLLAPSANSFIRHIFYMDDYVCFTTNDSFSEGNAAVAIQDASGNILWSWHLWFESDDLESLAQAYPGGPVFMDRNLGATANAYANDSYTYDYGLIYQWGRKDPFMNKGMLRSDSSITDPPYKVYGRDNYLLNGKMTVAQSILSPTQYAMQGESNWNEEGYKILWGTNKTMFDPCPPGWKVPVQLDFADAFTEALFEQEYNENGYSVPLPNSEQAWLPAASYRPGNTIQYAHVGGNYQYQYTTYATAYKLHSAVLHQWAADGAFGWRQMRVYPPGTNSPVNQDWRGLYDLDKDMNTGNPSSVNSDYSTGLNVYRSSLYPVRCVREDSQRTEPESVSLNITSATVYVGDQLQLVATVSPSDAVRKGVTWAISAGGGVSVDQNGLVTVIERIPPDYVSATITATTYNKKSASCVLTIQKPAFQAVDLQLPSGKKWANMNVGATTPHEIGYYFAWGETSRKNTNYDWSNYRYGTSRENLTKYNSSDKKTVLELSDDAARFQKGSPWRTPTKDEWNELFHYNNTTCEWVTRGDVSGYLVTSKRNGNWIFLPATGYKTGTSTTELGQGYYMAANVDPYGVYPYAQGYYYYLTASQYTDYYSGYRCYGYPVRAIQD